MHHECFAYYRVSTNRQGKSGLGLDAQRAAAHAYISGSEMELRGEFTEIESGKNSRRKELQKVLSACRRTNATLVIAKLDRLARNVHFISGLLESGVHFTAVDMPNADRFMLHLNAALAEEEARRISERTRDALRAAKARGVQLGLHGKVLALQNAQLADDFARKVGPTILELRVAGHSFANVARSLNELGVLSPRGTRWHATSAYRAHNRYAALIA